MIDLKQGNCLELMNDIKDKSIDMILCDLPYGATQNQIDKQLPFDTLWKQYNRIIKDNGAIVLFAQGLFYVDLVNSNRKMFKYDLIWDKVLTSGFLNAKRMPLRQHEQIAVFYKKLPTYNPQFTQGNKSHSKGTLFLNKQVKNRNYKQFTLIETNDKDPLLKYPTSIITFKKPHQSMAVHPTEKSIECLEWLIRTYTNEGDLVLDNCMGSGTTGIACVNTKRNFIGIELNEEYFKLASDRIKK
jgi:site-specific DNA-methyltransferase (adenine-specific)